MNTDNTREAAIDHELRDSAVNRCLDYLFANGSGQKAERLALSSKDGRDLGGWARAAMRDVIAKVFDAGAAASAERDKWRLALESLTPQGSEFYNDLENCMAWIEKQRQSGHEARKEVVRLKRQLKVLQEARSEV